MGNAACGADRSDCAGFVGALRAQSVIDRGDGKLSGRQSGMDQKQQRQAVRTARYRKPGARAIGP
jgi:hypothetical protein